VLLSSLTRWVLATDRTVVRLSARLFRAPEFEVEGAEAVTALSTDWPIQFFAPAYIGVGGVLAMLHFVPLPQPWGLVTYLAFSFFFGLACFHLTCGLVPKLRGSLTRQGRVASAAVGLTWVGILVALSFLAPPWLSLYS
jgi:hypothetical protein